MKRIELNIEEVRYGNFIKLQPDNITCIVHVIYGMAGVSAYPIDGIEALYPNKNQWHEPIPITEEWLYKFGFENSRISVNLADELCYDKYNKEIVYQTKGSGFIRRYGIKYIHQLQNLYFALTGEELKIK